MRIFIAKFDTNRIQLKTYLNNAPNSTHFIVLTQVIFYQPLLLHQIRRKQLNSILFPFDLQEHQIKVTHLIDLNISTYAENHVNYDSDFG